MMNNKEVALRILGFITIVMIVIGLVTLMVVIGRTYDRTNDREAHLAEKVRVGALRDLGLSENTEATVEFTGVWENVRWSEWDICLYTMKVGEKIYLVGVQRKKWEVHSVDVEGVIDENTFKE